MKKANMIVHETGTEFRRKPIANEMLKVKVVYAQKEETPEEI